MRITVDLTKLVSAIDEDFDPGAGHDAPSRKDVSVQFIVDGLCQTLDYMLVGNQYSAKNQLDNLEGQFINYVRKTPDVPDEERHSDPNYTRIVNQMTVTHARWECLQSAFADASSAWKELTGNEWTREDYNSRRNARSALKKKPSKMAEALAKKILEEHAA